MKKNHEEKLPKIEGIADEYPRGVYFITFIIFYFVFYCGITKLLIYKLNLFSNVTQKQEIIFNCVFMSIMAIIFIALYRRRLKRDFSILFKNFGTYLKYNLHIFLKYFAIYFLGSIVVAIIISSVSNGVTTSTNEEVLSEVPMWVTAILGIFVAPIVEEGMFRWTVRKVTDKKWLFILLSGFIFGLIHINYWGFQEWYQVLHIVQYGLLGMMMAEVYYNTNNLLASSLYHATWNAIVLLLQTIMVSMVGKI